jgi:methyl-accepting chemotaxis protein
MLACTLGVIAYQSGLHTSRLLVNHTLTQKLGGDIQSVQQYVKIHYGQLQLEQGKLTDATGNPLEGRFEMVDEVQSSLGVVATIFVKEGNDFRRISTNIRTATGDRAVGTLLGSQSSAYAPILRKERYLGNANILGQSYLTAYEPILNQNRELIGILFIGVSQAEVSAIISREMGAMVTWLLIGTTAILIAAFVCLYFISHMIATPIARTATMLKEIATGNGDLTVRLQVTGKDEVGELAHWFNVFVEKVQGIIRQIQSVTVTLSAASEELSSTSNLIAANTEEIAQQAHTVASATEQSTTNISSISAAAEEMSTSMSVVAAAVEELSASIGEVTRNCQRESEMAMHAQNEANETQRIIEALDQAGNSIGKIVDLIQQIAAQTNLLALNATIEAASAGDAGKGFAVVANEVKELARQTASATGDIRKQVETMQLNTRNAVQAISGIRKVVGQVNELSQLIVTTVSEQNKAVGEIAHNVSGANDGAQDVSRNVAESATALTEISGTISGVNTAVAENANGIVQVNQSADELAKLAASLSHIVGQFRV